MKERLTWFLASVAKVLLMASPFMAFVTVNSTLRCFIGIVCMSVVLAVLLCDALRWIGVKSLGRFIRPQIVGDPLWLLLMVVFAISMTIIGQVVLNSWLDTRIVEGYAEASGGPEVASDSNGSESNSSESEVDPNDTPLSDVSSGTGKCTTVTKRISWEPIANTLNRKLEKIAEAWVAELPKEKLVILASADEKMSALDATAEPIEESASEEPQNSDASEDEAALKNAQQVVKAWLDREQQSSHHTLTVSEQTLVLRWMLGPKNVNGWLAQKHTQDVGATADILVLFAFQERVLQAAKKKDIVLHQLEFDAHETDPNSSCEQAARLRKEWLEQMQQKLRKDVYFAIREALEKLDAPTMQLREQIEDVKSELNERTQVNLLVAYMPALRARLLFNGAVQLITIVFFWIGVFLFFRAILQLDQDSQKFIRDVSRLANAKNQLEQEQVQLDFLQTMYRSVSKPAQRLFCILRGISEDSLQEQSQYILRRRTIPQQKPEETKDRLTDDEANRIIATLRRKETETKYPKAMEAVESLLRSSVSSREYSQVPDALESSVTTMRDQTDTSLEFCRFVVWLLPSIGFVGTILGISQALMQSDRMVSAPPERTAQEVSAVTEYLGLAFDTTLIALVLSIIMVLLVHAVQYLSEWNISKVRDFLDAQIIKRLRSWPELVDEEEDV